MGDELVSDLFSPANQGAVADATAPFAYTKSFQEVFPYYLSIGMTYEQFWEDDPCLAKYYRKADKLKVDRMNQEHWLQGLYTYQAIMRLVPVLRAFSKATEPEKYLEEPIPITKEQIKEYNERKQKENLEKAMQRIKFFAQMNSDKVKADDIEDGNK